ncbi:MAG: N-6 DNA methylase [Solirubrobacteraceae bacterium]
MTGPADVQIGFALDPFANRKLFSDHFLTQRLPEWEEFAAGDPGPLLEDLALLWDAERAGLARANEAQTEERLVKPVLERLGFAFTVQAGIATAGGHRQPDYALFVADSERAAASGRTGRDRYRGAVAVCDAKRFERPLDRRRVRGALSEDPVAQIIHYIAITGRRWGVLTNGRLWRLYAAEGDMVEGACLEVDLGALLEARDIEAFRYFAVLFSAGAFAPGADGRSLLDRALEGSRAQTVAVGERLRRQVFSALPLIAEGLLDDDERMPSALTTAFDNALVVLYRLLFCLHAEDRDLLPVRDPHYLDYSLRRQRVSLAEDFAQGRVFSSRSDDKYNDLLGLFRIVDRGDPDLDVNEYNGSLFARDAHPWLRGRTVPDQLMAQALDWLYRVGGEQVDYRNLSVRHLGTIFEQLLAFELFEADNGRLALRAAGGRKSTGAWFTPEHIVDEIVERTLAPLYDERSVRARGAGAGALDVLLDLHVLDPAMGSGHFLVGAAAYLARRIANDPSYKGDHTLHELQGLVAERCLYGVDVNPMAVEVARLAMWLTTVRDDRPLRFLGNLRAGNSLVGAELRPLLEGGGDLFAAELAERARPLLDGIGRLTLLSATTADEAHAKEAMAEALDALRAPLLEACDSAVAPPVSTAAGRPFHWELEFPDRFLAADGSLRPDAGFDAVIGNPPYVRIQELGRDVAAYCRERYATAFGAFDAYVPFIERGLELLRGSGRLGFIVPNKFTKLDYGRRLRARLAAGELTESFVDFGHAQVFEGATNYTCVLVLDRKRSSEMSYTAVHGTSAQVRRAVAARELPSPERYANASLGAEPWLLVSGEDRAVLQAMQAAGSRLDGLTGGVFTGLQTSADSIYILEDRGSRGGMQVVANRDGEELELEPDLLHPLASGTDVERYALRPLRSQLLFPYARDNGQMKLLTEHALRALPRTWEYLQAHEEALRGRERGKMDRDGWWAYVYPKSLGAHDRAKLCVPRLCARLRASADPHGDAFLDNVDVNGVLLDPADVWAMTAVLNSRPVDFAFRRGSVPFQNAFFSANKQFISWLPVPDPSPRELDAHGRRLFELAGAIETERAGFVSWLESVVGVRLRTLKGHTKVLAYPQAGVASVLAVLDANRKKLSIDPQARAHRERIASEVEASSKKLAGLRRELAIVEGAVEDVLTDAYGLTAQQRRLIDAEYD